MDKNLTGVRPIHAIKHLHGRGFARAILADKPVNSAWLNAQIYCRIGQHIAKPFGQVAQFDCGMFIGCHARGGEGITHPDPKGQVAKMGGNRENGEELTQSRGKCKVAK